MTRLISESKIIIQVQNLKTSYIPRLLARCRFLNFYGDPKARIDRSQLVDDIEQPQPPTAVLWLSRFILFNAHSLYLTELKAQWVDRVAYADHWHQLLERLIHDWTETKDTVRRSAISDAQHILIPLIFI